MRHCFLLHDDWRADGRVIKKRLRHFFGDANTSVGRGVGRDVALMHRITTAEEHRVRHACAIVMCARWPGILARVDIGFYDVAKIVHVIAENSRDVRRILRQDCIMAGRSAESGFAGRDRRFADEMFAFIEIRMLLSDADNDLRRAGNAVTVPIAHRRRSRSCHRRRRGRVFGATRKKG